MFITSCKTKHIAYFENLTQDTILDVNNSSVPVIDVNDNLFITVASLNKEATLIFNSVSPEATYTNLESLAYKGYLVDEDGNINFPVIGLIKVAGYTKKEVVEMLKEKISAYIDDPVVNIRILNYKVTVLGEVARPGRYIFSDERATVLDALGMAGDLTIYGKRKNVLIQRRNGDKNEYIRLDLNSTDIFNSPYFYLQQNDIVYVTPNGAKANSSRVDQSTSFVVSIIATIASTVAVIINLTK